MKTFNSGRDCRAGGKQRGRLHPLGCSCLHGPTMRSTTYIPFLKETGRALKDSHLGERWRGSLALSEYRLSSSDPIQVSFLYWIKILLFFFFLFFCFVSLSLLWSVRFYSECVSAQFWRYIHRVFELSSQITEIRKVIILCMFNKTRNKIEFGRAIGYSHSNPARRKWPLPGGVTWILFRQHLPVLPFDVIYLK
jgi:hypothetical protein